MASNKKYYINFDGKKVEYIVEKALTLSQKTSFVMEVAGMTVSSEVGYAYLLKRPIFEYCLIKYFTNIVMFEDESMFSLDMIERFVRENRANVLDVIRGSMTDEEFSELEKACDEAIEYRKLHHNDFREEISDLLQVVREFVVKPDMMNEFLEALTNAVNKFSDTGSIDMDAVNKLVNIIPIMQEMGSSEVAKTIVKEFHDDKPKSNANKSKPKTNGNRKSKNSGKTNIEPNIEVVK